MGVVWGGGKVSVATGEPSGEEESEVDIRGENGFIPTPVQEAVSSRTPP
jgi:hypothetical protein